MRKWYLAAFAALMTLATPANAWWNKDWTYRKPVVIDTSPSGVNVAGPIGRTPVLVKLTSANFTFTDALDNGADIRFVDADDKTPLPYHVDSYDASTGIAYVWVSVTNVTGGEKHQVWLYFGNKTAGAGSDAKATFDADQSFAFHFAEAPGAPALDSTAYANNAAAGAAAVNDAGIIGRSVRFAGQDGLTIPETASLAMPAAAPFTFSAWVKPLQLGGEQRLFSRGAFVFGLNAGVPFVGNGPARAQASAAVPQAQWSHLAVVADGTTLKIYVNGVEAAAASVALPELTGPIALGGAAGVPGLIGELDEARLAKTARPAAMLLTMAQNEGPTSKLVSVSESAEKAEAGSTFFFILGKVEALDAGIIALCLALLALAIFVMITKSSYISAADRANAAFMKRYQSMRENLQPLDQVPGLSPNELKYLRTAPLARLYDAAIEERDALMALSRGRLSGEAVEAMRAAVDAQQVAENQKLDTWMVVLTIAIAGGPFIGLLGTVLGVMNTFGGVAIAGDVNVNAIAPGIAAALMATVAGLTCAIPALFGYNWLSGRIQALSDRMRVFVDRLVTNAAEQTARHHEMREAAE
ncbi:hypothetical protein IP88_03410 [alpha proteobacterium AAP81b]|nr:hypothetical protein IP88_03410 [alpha proteobacterium AAP81b]